MRCSPSATETKFSARSTPADKLLPCSCSDPNTVCMLFLPAGSFACGSVRPWPWQSGSFGIQRKIAHEATAVRAVVPDRLVRYLLSRLRHSLIAVEDRNAHSHFGKALQSDRPARAFQELAVL